MEPPTVVIDNGTGYTKMGYAGNVDPSYLIPSTIAYSLNKVSYKFCIFISLFHRKTPNLTIMRWIISSERKPSQLVKGKPIKYLTCLEVDKLKIGKVSRNSGTNPFSLT